MRDLGGGWFGGPPLGQLCRALLFPVILRFLHDRFRIAHSRFDLVLCVADIALEEGAGFHRQPVIVRDIAFHMASGRQIDLAGEDIAPHMAAHDEIVRSHITVDHGLFADRQTGGENLALDPSVHMHVAGTRDGADDSHVGGENGRRRGP